MLVRVDVMLMTIVKLEMKSFFDTLENTSYLEILCFFLFQLLNIYLKIRSPSVS